MNQSPQAKVLLAAEHTLAFLDSLHTTQSSQFHPSGFSGHSYHIGAATTASLPDHLNQKLGCWCSNTYWVYIYPPIHFWRDATSPMVCPH